LGAQKWGTLTITGPDEFKQLCAQLYPAVYLCAISDGRDLDYFLNRQPLAVQQIGDAVCHLQETESLTLSLYRCPDL
jgi:hypothetical protein